MSTEHETLPLDAQAVADHVGREMLAADPASRGLGIALEAIGPGTATMSMVVRADMLNGFGICHGGFITTLADSAFAFACNSANELSVAGGLSIEFLAPAQLNERLVAQAKEISLRGRTGVYDVIVTNPKGERIALMRGRSHRVGGKPTVPARR